VLRRRLTTLPALYFGTPLVTLALPLLLVVALVFDMARLRWRCPTVRILLFAACYLWLTVGGVSQAFWIRIRAGLRPRAPAAQARYHELQRWWVSGLIGCARPLLGLRVEVDNLEELREGPIVVMSRHTSIFDAIVSFVVVGLKGRRATRYVLKQALRWEPALDVVGHQLRNHFVDRTGAGGEAEIEAVGRLGAYLGDNDAVVIFPEGTFPSPERHQRAIERLSERPQLQTAAKALTTLLPPRTRGTARLLQVAPGADVVMLGHVGFEAMSSIPTMFRTMPFRAPVRVRLWRYPAADIPRDGAELDAWIFDRWVELDRWVTDTLAQRQH
jgi:1-acyl-sn-glycerol-3-phosphate acyltransferase